MRPFRRFPPPAGRLDECMNTNKLALLLDFDGTVTGADIGSALIRKFGAEGWDRGIRRYDAGEIGVRELLEWETRHLPVSRLGDMRQFAVERATIRPGLRELTDYARRNEIYVEVVSNGWEFYIREVLHRSGFDDLKSCSPVAFFGAGQFAELRYEDGIEVCSITGLCKCERVRLRQREGRSVMYVGDGISDICVAGEADCLMARRELADHCDKKGIAYTPFDDMFDVLQALERLAAT